VLRYACVLLICLQFILSMGNRPQGARKMFLATMVIYSVIMAYTTFCAIYIVAIQLKDHTLQKTPKDQSPYQLGNNMFTNLIVSTISTVGLYFLMSFLYLDPWHMFTSSAQYFALLPSYICTLQVYAFCNTHDVTWGTKGDNVIYTDLGAAKSTAAGKDGFVEVEMPSEQLDIDSGYDEALRNLRDRLEVPTPGVSESQQQEDYYRAVRTYMVAAWMVSNAILAMAVSEAYSSTHVADNYYLSFILWAVAALAFFRALGSTAFQVLGMVTAVVEGWVQRRFKRIFGGEGEGSEGRSWGRRSERAKSVSGGKSVYGETVAGKSEGGRSVGSRISAALSSKFSWMSGGRG
jgi:chitin synthase